MIRSDFLWTLAKGLEGVGMIVVLGGLVLSITAGMHDEGMKSMRGEAYGLAIGGGLFLVGWWMERKLGAR